MYLLFTYSSRGLIRASPLHAKYPLQNSIMESVSPFFPSPRQTRSKQTVSKGLKSKLDDASSSNKPPPKKRTIANATSVSLSSSISSPIQVKDLNAIPNKETQWEPKHWRSVLDKLRKMRSAVPAPVDTMGCHMCADVDADPKAKRFHILIALMLSSQTKDEV